MLNRWRQSLAASLLALLLQTAPCLAQQDQDPLPSWIEGPAKKAILTFVRETTAKDSPKFVPVAERIATFDEDGTTWVEHPMYTEVVYSLDRVVELAPKRPEWNDKLPFKAVIDGDKTAMAKFGMDDLLAIVVATHSGVTIDEFDQSVKQWIGKAKHPRWERPYTALVYQPMLEVMRFLRANGFKTYIVTGGTQPFVRAFAEQTYGIPPEQIIGTALKTKFTPMKDGNSLLLEPKLLLNNNFSGKAEDIELFIGRRPYAAFGNSTGDQQMLEYTTAGNGARLGMLVMHDDATREFAYGPAEGLTDTKVGTFTQALYDEAKKKGWPVISMKNDWKRLFAFDK
jgi:hypothetical protein